MCQRIYNESGYASFPVSFFRLPLSTFDIEEHTFDRSGAHAVIYYQAITRAIVDEFIVGIGPTEPRI